MQRKRFSLCMHMAAGGIKGLIYLEARACFSVHSGIRIFCHVKSAKGREEVERT